LVALVILAIVVALTTEWQRQRSRREQALGRPALVIDGLRCGPVQHGVAVEMSHLDEHRASLFRATPAHGAKNSLGLAAAQITGHPDA
jgi:hypothetical protein